ncbi:MAG: DUF1957 domain-containing protein [Treponema sp.]
MIKKKLLFIFYAHAPYIRSEQQKDTLESFRFFETLSYGLLPFLRMCGRLDTAGVPFKCALVISPLLCEMLQDPLLQNQYCASLDKHIAFTQDALNRAASETESRLTQLHLDSLIRNRKEFIEDYKKNILKHINTFVAKGAIELIATAATPCFFPLYQDMPAALNAQIELGIAGFRDYFSASPTGFWLPAMGYNTGLERIIKPYGLDYTVLESQSFLFADSPPMQGVFSPAMSENGLAFFGKDCSVHDELLNAETGLYRNPCYLDTDKDIGFELDGSYLAPLFDVEKGRYATGLCYCCRGGKTAYNPEEALLQAEKDADRFLANRRAVLNEAGSLLNTDMLCSVCVLPLQFLGKVWFEGMQWLERVFVKLAGEEDISCIHPAEYLQTARRMPSIEPFYASNLPSGYADELISSSNDWMLPRIRKATERMIDLAARFPNDPGLKERVLNMAAKEVLLAQSMDWPLMVDSEFSAEYAAQACEEHIKAFTAVYESLGAGAVSTDWLIKREKKYPIFTEMNYRLFIKQPER